MCRCLQPPTFSWSVLTKPTSAVLATVSSGCPPLLGRSPTSYSPVRHSRPCLGHRPPQSLPSDLHALGTPLAFILSQDQTLRICPCATFQVAPSGCFGSIQELFFRTSHSSYHFSTVKVLSATFSAAKPLRPDSHPAHKKSGPACCLSFPLALLL